MPTWGEILNELNQSQLAGSPPNWDGVRRKYLQKLSLETKRNTILYATKFTQRDPNVPSELISISDEDVQGLMEVVHGLRGRKLDLILHSPGGSLDAAEGIVNYLRAKFSDIRVIVPQLAQSAATMICCAADVVIMGKHSSLGPTDPQIYVRTALGQSFVPAQAIIDQFNMAKAECVDQEKLAAWAPMLAQYGPHLVKTCAYLIEASKELVEDWLSRYMFRTDARRKEKAARLATWLSDHTTFKTHQRHISRTRLKRMGMKVIPLERNQKLQDLVLSTFHATTHTFDGSPAVKIIENHMGKAFLKQTRQMMLQIPTLPPTMPLQMPMQMPGVKP